MARGNPPVGYPVQFFKDGDTRGTPAAAIVVNAYGNGMCDLKVFTGHQGNGTPFQDCVFLNGDPELDRRDNWRTIYGVWDYVPGLPRQGYLSDEDLESQAAEQALLADEIAAERAAEQAKKNKKRQLQPA